MGPTPSELGHHHDAVLAQQLPTAKVLARRLGFGLRGLGFYLSSATSLQYGTQIQDLSSFSFGFLTPTSIFLSGRLLKCEGQRSAFLTFIPGLSGCLAECNDSED